MSSKCSFFAENSSLSKHFPTENLLFFFAGITQESEEWEEGAFGWGSAVYCGSGSRSKPSVPGNNSLMKTEMILSDLCTNRFCLYLSVYHQPHVFLSCLSVLPLQRSAVLENIWNLDDIWPASLCRVFILQWASMLESKVLIWEYRPFPEGE